MKRIALLTVVFTATTAPAQISPGVSEPDFYCRADGFCIIKNTVLEEIIRARRPICQDYNT